MRVAEGSTFEEITANADVARDVSHAAPVNDDTQPPRTAAAARRPDPAHARVAPVAPAAEPRSAFRWVFGFAGWLPNNADDAFVLA
jgi:hypothetical protein